MATEGTREKQSTPVHLRTRLTMAFGLFALVVVSGLGTLAWHMWKSTPGQIVPILLTAGAFVVAIAAFTGYLVAGKLARPMEMWAKAADRIGLGERDVVFPSSGGSHELARVSAALQSMFHRLSEKEEALQARISERTAELQSATEALALERERLANALDGSRIAYWDLDIPSGQVRMSAEWSRFLGEDKGETLTTVKDLLQRVPEEEHGLLSARIFAVMKGKQPLYDLDHRVRRNDGTWMWVRSRGRVMARDAKGHAIRMIGTNVDITARHLEHAEWRAREQRLRRLMDGVASAICHVDLEGRILFANARYHEYFGQAPGEAIGRTILDVAKTEGASAFEEALPQLKQGETVHYIRDALFANGTLALLEVRLVPHRDEAGTIDGVYAMLTDISDRK
ncbi:hypothetical protein DSM104443_01648 [Usitatibacter rugosus]|uniref:histidine kinase n=1 Tax=Usitatibacter rugosus TaxID=2732067 RepID=A0A6M4GVR9_9PROT|nr:PAS domain-containing protein [Usitatibacter rugosus]QJR10584.1 hypothetical protein DSM104443_01648 [Usitatibacter rugosus]